ncbi:hypothetical protein GGH96_002785 [Coemansia sp. RSA 1972]|nr:hypothetical protein GGH96_002785 [Coemansia sp. RSA 1972]
MIRLESSDGRLFAVDQDSAYMSSLLKNIDQDLGTDINPILLPNVTGTILARVIEYCMHHRDDVWPDKDIEDLLQDDTQVETWDRQFMNVDDSTMLQILYAADYLGIEPLVDLGCMFIAHIIRDMPVDEIRLRYGVVEDFTDAQRQQIQLEIHHSK